MERRRRRSGGDARGRSSERGRAAPKMRAVRALSRLSPHARCVRCRQTHNKTSARTRSSSTVRHKHTTTVQRERQEGREHRQRKKPDDEFRDARDRRQCHFCRYCLAGRHVRMASHTMHLILEKVRGGCLLASALLALPMRERVFEAPAPPRSKTRLLTFPPRPPPHKTHTPKPSAARPTRTSATLPPATS